MSDDHLKQDPDPKLRAWLEQEKKEQADRYAAILREMDALAPQRDRWVEEFLERIQTQGFHMDGDLRVKIPKDKIPKAPQRKFKVVF